VPNFARLKKSTSKTNKTSDLNGTMPLPVLHVCTTAPLGTLKVGCGRTDYPGRSGTSSVAERD